MTEKLSSSTHSQRQRLIDHLEQHNEITTIEARELYDIMSPAPRIMELKARGYNIVTIPTDQHTDKGSHKRVARYVLFPNGGRVHG
jgi:hypothetical protein